MFKLIGKLYRWYSRVMLIKIQFMLFGLVAFLIFLFVQDVYHWQAAEGDSVGTIPDDCYIAITEQPLFVPFQDYQNQPLQTINGNERFNGSMGRNSWSLSAKGEVPNTYNVSFHEGRGFFSHASFTYRIDDNQIVPVSCLRARWGVSVPVSLLITLVLAYLLRRLVRRFKPNDEDELQQVKCKVKEKRKKKTKTNVPESVIDRTKSQQNRVIER